MPAQQMKRMTFGSAALSVRMRIWKRADHIPLNQRAKPHRSAGRRLAAVWTYVVLLEVAHVADDADPHQHGSCPEEDAADVVAGDVLTEVGVGQRGGASDGVGGRSGRRLPCSRSLFSGWSRWCSACRWRWWGCTSRSRTPACRTRGRLSRRCSCSTGCIPGYSTRSVSRVLPPLVKLSAEFEPPLHLYPLSCCFRLEVTVDGSTCAFWFCHPNPIIINIRIGSLTHCRRIPVRTERVQRMKETMQVRMMTQSNASVR